MSRKLKEQIENIKDGEVLHLEGGRYEIFPDIATPIERNFPCYQSVRSYAFVIENKKNIVIDGRGADLIFHGSISPFRIDRCENITLRNFNIDYAVPGSVYGTVMCDNGEYFDLDFSKSEFNADVTEDGSLHFFDNAGEREKITRCAILDEIDSKTNTMIFNRYFVRLDPVREGDGLAYMYRKSRFEKIGENLIRFHVERDFDVNKKPTVGNLVIRERTHTVGNYILFDVAGRENVNFQIDRCTDVHLENINMHASMGLAVITTNCKDLYFNSVNSVVRKDSHRITAVKDDVFHLVATRGEVMVENCILENMKDDALNIHSFYLTARERVGANSVIIGISGRANRIFDFCTCGQKLRVLNPDYTDTGLVYTVKEHSYASESTVKLTFEEELDSAVTEGCLFDDSVEAATVTVRDCHIRSTLGRIVIQTPSKAVIENCRFDTVGHAVIVNGRSKIYGESAPSKELIIRNNVFNGMGERTDICTGIGCYNPENKIIYGSVTVENNSFVSHGGGHLGLKYFDKVIIRGNSFGTNPSFTPKSQKSNIETHYCNSVEIE